jgi:hypothetical protein
MAYKGTKDNKHHSGVLPDLVDNSDVVGVHGSYGSGCLWWVRRGGGNSGWQP